MASYWAAFMGSIVMLSVIFKDWLPESFGELDFSLVAALYAMAAWLAITSKDKPQR